MATSAKPNVQLIVQTLQQQGVKQAVLCPGTRNAPLIIALEQSGCFECLPAIDERSAAFIALGLALQSQSPVAVVCTSGSAVLNFAPGAAEALYRGVPLIMITADRPKRFVNQQDSQTIIQPGALGNVVKTQIDIPDFMPGAPDTRLYWRMVNDAISLAVSPMQGPVHINVQLGSPLETQVDTGETYPALTTVKPDGALSTARARALGAMLAPPCKVLIVCGFMTPSQKISRAIHRLATLPHVVVMAEAQSNIHADGVIYHPEELLTSLTRQQRSDLLPDVVITIGGSILSQLVKEWLRNAPGLQHWSVQTMPDSIDVLFALTTRIEMEPRIFMPQLASAMALQTSGSQYSQQWRSAQNKAREMADKFFITAPWSDVVAVRKLISEIPEKFNLHISNGMAVRLVQTAPYSHIHRIDSNRGVSGIDGCTSTAIGASWNYKSAPTVLLTGDMSAQYDLGALASTLITGRLRIAVLNNNGGQIFRIIKTTRNLAQLEQFLAAKVNLPLPQLADGFGFRYLEAASTAQLEEVLPKFLVMHSEQSVILNIITSPEVNTKTYTEYLTRKNIMQ